MLARYRHNPLTPMQSIENFYRFGYSLSTSVRLRTPDVDRQARISAGAGARAAFRPRRRSLRRDPADAVGRHQAARGDARRAAGATRLALPSASPPEGERVLDWARRIVGDARAMRAGDQRAAARPHRAAAHRRDPDRAGDGGAAHHAVSARAIPNVRFTICRAPRSRS